MSPLDVPILIGREEARLRAAAELAKAKYGGTPSVITRLLDRLEQIVEQILRLLDVLGAGRQSGSGVNLGFVIAIALLLVAIVLVVWRVGLPRWRRRQAAEAVDSDPTVAATDYRGRASAHAAAGDWRGAVRDRFRAIVRELEDATILDVRPARTAREAAAGASWQLPGLRAELTEGAEEFNDVVFGDRPADARTYDRMVTLDEAVTAAAAVVDLAAGAESAETKLETGR